MSVSLKIFLFIILLIQFFLIMYTIKSRRISMRYASFWIFILILMSVTIIFPNFFMILSDFFGFEATSNMIFLMGFFFLFYIIFVLTISLSKQQDIIKTLIQELSMLKSKLSKEESE